MVRHLVQLLLTVTPLLSCRSGGPPADGGKLIVAGFNTGMASGDAALKRSWEKDIALLLSERILTLFTCANDHNDLKCVCDVFTKGIYVVEIVIQGPSFAMTPVYQHDML